MATFRTVVLKHQKKSDNTWNVKICVYHQGQRAYISTEYYVTRDKLTKNYILNDQYLVNILSKRLVKYNEVFIGMDSASSLTARELAAELAEIQRTSLQDRHIDFIAFSEKHIGKIIDSGEKKYGMLLQTAVNTLKDFFRKDQVAVTEITSRTLQDMEEYIRSDRDIKRRNQFGREVIIHRKGASQTGVNGLMRNIRTLFNACREEYNDPEKGIVKINHYPFAKYKVKADPESHKRSLPASDIAKIIREPRPDNERAALARDVFLLSFSLLGMNTVDLYTCTDYIDGRIVYRRKKTTNRRLDNAEISVLIPVEMRDIFERNRDETGKRVFNFYRRYASAANFNNNMNKGLKDIANTLGLGIPLSTYYARHSFATIARNQCRISMDDVALCLNHSDGEHRITDIYVAKDWSVIDDAQRKVLDFVNAGLASTD